MQEMTAPNIVTSLPGPNARRVIEEDAFYMSPSYTRCYPLVVKRGRGVIVEDVDGNTFLDFSAGIAVVAMSAIAADFKNVVLTSDHGGGGQEALKPVILRFGPAEKRSSKAWRETSGPSCCLC